MEKLEKTNVPSHDFWGNISTFTLDWRLYVLWEPTLVNMTEVFMAGMSWGPKEATGAVESSLQLRTSPAVSGGHGIGRWRRGEDSPWICQSSLVMVSTLLMFSVLYCTVMVCCRVYADIERLNISWLSSSSVLVKNVCLFIIEYWTAGHLTKNVRTVNV